MQDSGMGRIADRIVIVGGGGHAKVLISVLRKLSWDLAGYTDKRDNGVILGVPYLGDDAIMAALLDKDRFCRSAIIGLGKMDTSPKRINLQDEIKALGFDFPIAVSPQGVVNEEVRLGPGTVVMDGAVINCGTVIGDASIINTNSTVEHDCRIGNNVHIASGATIGGAVTVGSNCMVGAGANVIQGVTICADCLVGAGATVVKDLVVPGTYVGTPAREKP